MADELQAFDGGLVVEPEVAHAPPRLREQALTLVVTDGVDAAAGAPGHLADADVLVHFVLSTDSG